MVKRFFRLCLLIFFAAGIPFCSLHAQDSLIRTIPVANVSFITLDPNGNLYVVSRQNTLLRFDKDGMLTGQYNNIQNGQLQWVDASNPLKILLFYPQFSKIILLDNMMSPKTSINLQQSGFFNISVCGLSEDNNIWLYDYQKAKLFKLSNQMEILSESNDLRAETGTRPYPTGILASGNTVYLSDTSQGIYTFDRFGNYLNTLSIKSVGQLQKVNQQLIWYANGQLHNYNLQNFRQKNLSLSAGARNALVSRDRLYILQADKIAIFYSDND
ncbi:MAG TPA: hypothetical protein VFL76_10070 [Edaphocola sp.]|nr:hypothetical protein [Edaphocola sp.]